MVAPSLHWEVMPVIVALIITAMIVKVSAIAEMSGTTIILEATIITWCIMVVIPAIVMVILVTVAVLVRVV